MKIRHRKTHKISCECMCCKIKRRELVGKLNPAYKKGKILVTCKLCQKQFKAYEVRKRNFCSLNHAYTYRLIEKYLKTKNILEHCKDKIFLSWLAAFWEGEGSLSYTKKCRSGILNITQKNYRIISYIKRKLKIGGIAKHSTNGCFSFLICNYGTLTAFLQTIKKYVRIDRRKKQIKLYFKKYRVKELLKYV